jgi:hypothetical protein
VPPIVTVDQSALGAIKISGRNEVPVGTWSSPKKAGALLPCPYQLDGATADLSVAGAARVEAKIIRLFEP